MGATLPEITRSLLSTCPRGGVLVTAESDPELLAIMREEAGRRGSRLFIADPDEVRDEYLRRFPYVEFKENVAVGLAIAALLGVRRTTALRGMLRAPADPGVLRIEELRLGGKQVTWANAFAANDRQSVLTIVQELYKRRGPATTTVALLNNRADRADRALLFADIVTRDLAFDRIAMVGAYEQAVGRRIAEHEFPASRIIRLGEHRDLSVDEMLQKLVLDMPTEHVVLVGLGNVHTHQAEMIVQRLEQCTAGGHSHSPVAFSNTGFGR
jgi:poly-gamma-glutamate synthase PgsB/CapB